MWRASTPNRRIDVVETQVRTGRKKKAEHLLNVPPSNPPPPDQLIVHSTGAALELTRDHPPSPEAIWLIGAMSAAFTRNTVTRYNSVLIIILRPLTSVDFASLRQNWLPSNSSPV